MRVRRLTAADAEAFRAIRLESLHLAPDAFAATLADEDRRPLDHFRQRLTSGHVVGSFDGTRLMGIAAYDRERHGNTRHRATFTSVYVRPDGRGQGRLGAMLEDLAAVAVADGVRQLELHVALDNAPAIAACRRAGFAGHGIVPRAILSGERCIDEQLMVWPLDG
jgi:ribosomal protein S18 acetylase RimI-like enzyme